MFFRRLKKEPEFGPDANVTTSVVAQVSSSPMAGEDAAPDDAADPSDDADARPIPHYSTTADLEVCDAWLGQDQVTGVLEAALLDKARRSGLCIVSPPGSGARRAVCDRLHAFHPGADWFCDWIYVHNFDDFRRPIAIKLKSGAGNALAGGMLAALSELCVTLSVAFDSDDYKTRHRAIIQSSATGLETRLSLLRQQAAAQNIALLRTPDGYALAPMHDGKVVKPAIFGQLPQAMRDDIAARIAVLQAELVGILAATPHSARRQYQELEELQRGFAERSVAAAFADLESAFKELPGVASFIASAKTSLVRNRDIFEQGKRRGEISFEQDSRFQRYLVNVFVARSETTPTVMRLADAQPAFAPALLPGGGTHMNLTPAPLHFVNGAVLLVTSEDLERESGRALCESLARQEIDVACPGLTPMPLPFDVKVVVLCDERSLKRLQCADACISSLVKTAVRWTSTLERTTTSEQSYARWIAGLVERDKRLPLTAAAVNALIEDSAARAESPRRSLRTLHRRPDGALSLCEEVICDVIAEAHRGALLAEDKLIDAGHVRHALAQRAAATLVEPTTPVAVG